MCKEGTLAARHLNRVISCFHEKKIKFCQSGICTYTCTCVCLSHQYKVERFSVILNLFQHWYSNLRCKQIRRTVISIYTLGIAMKT